MYFWITEVVPYLRNDIWLLSVKTNSILYELERFISINSVNPLSGNRRDVMSFLQCLCKAALEPLEEGWLFGGHQCSAVHFDVLWFSACAPEFLSDSAVWSLEWGILSWEIIVQILLSLWSYVIRVKPVSRKHRSSVTSREESRCGSQ